MLNHCSLECLLLLVITLPYGSYCQPSLHEEIGANNLLGVSNLVLKTGFYPPLSVFDLESVEWGPRSLFLMICWVWELESGQLQKASYTFI